MFNNLIESTSHAGEFKRRGSFVLFTTATYVLFFIVAGVASIYAYDARLDDQNTEFITMLSPLDFPAAPTTVKNNTPPARVNPNRPTIPVREQAMASVNVPQVVPVTTSATPNKNLPVPDRGPYTIGGPDSDPVEVGGSGTGRSGGNGNSQGIGNNAATLIEILPPPPLPTPVARKILTVSSVLNGRAVDLPKPLYPTIAKQARAEGRVNVQVLIDESGKVISAKAISGNPMLMSAAQQAALQARFSPTKLNDQAVKVSGVIVYNFMLQ